MHKCPHGRKTLVEGDPGTGLGPEVNASGMSGAYASVNTESTGAEGVRRGNVRHRGRAGRHCHIQSRSR